MHVTNGENYDPQDRASIAASRGNKNEHVVDKYWIHMANWCYILLQW